MKNKTLILITFFLLLGSSKLTAGNAIFYSSYNCFQQKEQAQEPKTDSAKKGKDATKKASADGAKAKDDSKKLVQKFLGFFRFRYNRDKRIEKIIENTGLKDSLVVTQEKIADLAELVAKLADTVNQNTDSLIRIISTLDKQNKAVIIDIKKRDSIAKLLDSIARLPKTPRTGDNTPASDMEKLAMQIQKIAEKEKNTADQKSKATTVAAMRGILSASGKTYVLTKATDNKDEQLVTKYNLKVNPNSKVVFFYEFGTPAYIPPQHNLQFLSNIIVNNAFFITETGAIRQAPGIEKDLLLTDPALRKENKFIFSLTLKASSEKNFLLERSINSDPIFVAHIESILSEKELYYFSGVNIDLTKFFIQNLTTAQLKNAKKNLTFLVNKLASILSSSGGQKMLFVTLPSIPVPNLLNLNEIDNRSFFIIDFTKTSEEITGPADPIKGFSEIDNSIELGFGTYVNNYNIAPDRYLLALPYKGIQWKLMPGSNPDVIQGYLPYHQIIRTYSNETILNDETYSNAYINLTNQTNRIISQIWFNNASSLSVKYDFVNNNKLGGIAINALGDDSTRPELWDMLFYKFGKIDTLNKTTDSLVINSIKPATLLEKIKYRIYLYTYILQNPCAVCFENIPDSAKRAEINIILQKLSLYKKVQISRLMSIQGKDSHKSYEYPLGGFANTFEVIQYELTFVLRIASQLLAVLITLLAVFGFWKIKTKGDSWPYKKWILPSISILLVILFTTTVGYFFVRNDIPFFGAFSVAQKNRDKFQQTIFKEVKPKTSIEDSLELYKDSVLKLAKVLQPSGIQNNEDTTKAKKISAKEELINQMKNSCTPEQSEIGECMNMPFYTLIGIAFLGIILGYLVARLLLLFLLAKKEIPVVKKK